MEVEGDVLTFQQNERNYEEGEKGSNTLCRYRKSHRKKPRGEAENIVLNTSAGEDVFI